MIALILLNYNDADETIAFIERCRNYESIDKIVVVDNCSTDDSYQCLNRLVDQQKIYLIRTEANLGYAAGNNAGICFALNNWELTQIIISNPDVFVSDETIEKLTTFLQQHNEVMLAGPTIRCPDDSLSYGWDCPTYLSMMKELFVPASLLRKHIDYQSIRQEKERHPFLYVDCLSGCFFAFNVQNFTKAGCFDETTFLYGEESILGFRAKKMQFCNAILPGVQVLHNESVSINKNIISIRRKAEILLTSRKYYMREYMHCTVSQVAIYSFLYHSKLMLKIVFNKLFSR